MNDEFNFQGEFSRAIRQMKIPKTVIHVVAGIFAPGPSLRLKV